MWALVALFVVAFGIAARALVHALRRVRDRGATKELSTGAGLAIVALVVAGCTGTTDVPADPAAGKGAPPPPARGSPAPPRPQTAPPDGAAPDARHAPSPREEPLDQRRYAVLDVVDGDTVRVAYLGGTTIRVIGIDTPETHAGTECYGAEATDQARALLAGQSVTLTFDPSQGRTDIYGRTLAYVGLADGRDFGLTMIRDGYAVEYTHDTPYARQSSYRATDGAARSEDAGLWAACGGPDTVLTPTPTWTPPPEPTDAPVPEPEPAPGLGGGLPPPPPDLDCSDVGGPVAVGPGDPHRLDADGDGTGCDP